MPGEAEKPGRRAARRSRKRERILKAARALLHDHGHEQLSLRAVARRARSSPAGIYNCFASREDLLDTLAGETRDALVHVLKAAEKSTDDPEERLVQMGLAHIRFARCHPKDYLLLFSRPSRRSGGEPMPPDSPFWMFKIALAQLVDPVRHPKTLSSLCFYFWSALHGMAVLHLTHLADYPVDLDVASAYAIKSAAHLWRRTDWGDPMWERTDWTKYGAPGKRFW